MGHTYLWEISGPGVAVNRIGLFADTIMVVGRYMKCIVETF